MQSPHDTSRGHSYQRHQPSLSSTHYPDHHHNGQAVGYHHPVMSNVQPQRPYGTPQDHLHSVMMASNHAAVPGPPIAQQSGSSISHQYLSQQYASDGQQAVLLNPGVPAHYQNYRPIEHGQPIVPSQPHGHGQYVTPQKPYPSPAMQAQGGHAAQYSNPANHPSSPTGYGSSSPPSSSSSSPHACGVCGATFTRPHDRKRHYESQHTTIEHVCQYCRKSYARVDSLKRHLDRPCDKMPQAGQKGA
ncbi:hypothetical protein BJY52DRAFT_644987 [Lactarius psammicola]|nr:hypothetical protein BJY52DRAFT_644987 [Lactarius psammicola]